MFNDDAENTLDFKLSVDDSDLEYFELGIDVNNEQIKNQKMRKPKVFHSKVNKLMLNIDEKFL